MKINHILIILFILGISCNNQRTDSDANEYKRQIAKDSAERERKFKIIDFATQMAILKTKQGYDSSYVNRFRDSILRANNIEP